YRGKAVNFIYVRSFQTTEELSGIGRKGLYITPLPLCIDGVEGQGRLAATGKTGNDYQFFPWNGNVYIFEVMDPSAPNLDIFLVIYHYQMQRCKVTILTPK